MAFFEKSRKGLILCAALIAVLMIGAVPMNSFAGGESTAEVVNESGSDTIIGAEMLAQAELVSEDSTFYGDDEAWTYQIGDTEISISMSPYEHEVLKLQTGTEEPGASVEEMSSQAQELLDAMQTDETSEEGAAETEAEGESLKTSLTVLADSLKNAGADKLTANLTSTVEAALTLAREGSIDEFSVSASQISDLLGQAEEIELSDGTTVLKETSKARSNFQSAPGLISKDYGGETLSIYKFWMNGRPAFCFDPSVQNASDDAYNVGVSVLIQDGVMAAIFDYGWGGDSSLDNSNDAYIDTWVALIHRKGVIFGSENAFAKIDRCFQSAEGAYARELYQKAEASPLTDFTIEVYDPNGGGPILYQRMMTLVKSGSVQVVKTDAHTGERLAGAQFQIAETSQVLTTDENGQASVSGLSAGTYTITEIKAPSGYENDAPAQQVYTNGRTASAVFSNSWQKAGIEVYKTADQFTSYTTTDTEWGEQAQLIREEKPLEGVSFAVYFAEDNERAGKKKDELACTITTDENGIAKAENLELGRYYIVETSSPEGYQISTEKKDIDLTDADALVSMGNTVSVAFKNDPQKPAIAVEKNDEVLVGFDQNGDELIVETEEAASNGSVFGIYTAQDLDLTFVQTEESSEETLQTDAADAEAEEDTVNENILPAGTLVSVLVIEDGKAVTTEDLPFGEYYVKELQTADESLVLDPNDYPVTLTPDGNDAEVIVKATEEPIVNCLIRSDFELTKTDVSTGDVLPNTGVVIYDKDKNPIFEGRTDEEGKIKLEKLPYGTYYYQEFDAPDGYQLDESLFEFSVSEDGSIIKCEMTNRLLEKGEEKIVSSYNPKTGQNGKSMLPVIGGMFAVGGSAGIALQMMKKKKREQTEA